MFNTIVTHGVTLTFLGLFWLLTPDLARNWYANLATLGSVLYASYLIASFVDNALPRFRVTATTKAVFITGCDTGFGNMLAMQLDSIGYKVFAGCLFENGQGAETLRNVSTRDLQIVQVDVTSDKSVQAALNVVQERLGSRELWAVVNNAGIIARGELEWTPLEVYQKQIDVNTLGAVRVTQAFLPLLRKYKGRVVTTTSVAGRFTCSGYVPYCMSKHAITSFCDGLRLEMAKFGVKVITVEPFSYKSAMTETSTMLQSVEDTWSKCPEQLQSYPYDREYIKVFKESVRLFNERTQLTNVHNVVNALVEAVCAVSPHYSYQPGNLKFGMELWVSKRLPATISDYMVRKTISHDCIVDKYLNEKRLDKKVS